MRSPQEALGNVALVVIGAAVVVGAFTVEWGQPMFWIGSGVGFGFGIMLGIIIEALRRAR